MPRRTRERLQPGLLHDVLGRVRVAQQPTGEPPQEVGVRGQGGLRVVRIHGVSVLQRSDARRARG